MNSDVARFTTLSKPVHNLICCKKGLIWVVKRTASLFNLFFSNVARQVARFFFLPVLMPFNLTFIHFIVCCHYLCLSFINIFFQDIPGHSNFQRLSLCKFHFVPTERYELQGHEEHTGFSFLRRLVVVLVNLDSFRSTIMVL